ncbi:mitochondrial nicotinamide adenine dinucleotide transporter SLC25A51-like [Mercenaria mercenaria]|uniref:mitochondrial nicotinamide adenine dinucleotide transporter SLC25A51-like n=1 Tax=Mercenaria mercenaria TaxID=6596 RepID=UPI00234F92C1|nr:mitochondrial nicotinamide adenine dinucleotide transporter SLC25A51-like [Mercenaria mercenaria]
MTQGEKKHLGMPSQHVLRNFRKDSSEGLTRQWQRPEFVCGWGAAFVNISVTFPINKVMFRQQLYGVRVWKAIQQLQKEGLTHIYRGLMPPLLQKTTSMSIMFGLYYEFQRHLNSTFPSVWSPVNKSVAAMLAGTVESVLTPFERVQVLLQDRTYHRHYGNTLHAFSEIRQTHGIKEFYRGQTAILLRNGPSNVLFFLGRDYLHMVYPADETAGQKVLLDFVSGACLGAFLSSLFYPLNVVKVRMQSKVGGEFVKVLPTFKKILMERNYSIKKLYRGLHINYTRAFISWGIVNATYEFLMKHFKNSDEMDES